MKKILALILLVCCLFAVVSCGDNGDKDSDPLAKISSMLASAAPTKSVTTTTRTFEDSLNELKSVATITSGTVDGKEAAVFELVYDTYSTLDSGKPDVITTKTRTEWYVEGKGVCVNKSGSWDEEGTNFAPKAGSIKLDLDANNIEKQEWDAEAGKLTLKIKEKNIEKVIGDLISEDQRFDSDLTIIIETAGANISAITLRYSIEGEDVYLDDDSDDYVYIEGIEVEIKAVYEYDYQLITLA